MPHKDKKYATTADFMNPKHVQPKEFDPATAEPLTAEEVAKFDPTSHLTEAGQTETVEDKDIIEDEAA